MDCDSVEVASLCTVELDKPPCCLAFSPVHRDLLVVGSYNLELQNSSSQPRTESLEADLPQRDGSLTLYRVRKDQIIHVQTLNETNGAVLDLQFFADLIFVCTSLGIIGIYHLVLEQSDRRGQPRIELVRILRVANAEVLITSLAINSATHISRSPIHIAFTATTGDVKILQLSPEDLAGLAQDRNQSLTEDSGVQLNCKHIYSHKLEAWICALPSPRRPTRLEDCCIWSGGDDSVFHVTHISLPARESPEGDVEDTREDAQATSNLDFSDRRIHEAGVTALLPLIISPSVDYENENETQFLLTGSYDDHLRVLALCSRSPADSTRYKPEVVGSVCLGGGVWRIKVMSQTWGYDLNDGKEEDHLSTIASSDTVKSKISSHEDEAREQHHRVATAVRLTLVVACMYAGACVIDVRFRLHPLANGNWDCEFKILGWFKEHGSICYGVEIQSHVDDTDSNTRVEVHAVDEVQKQEKKRIVSCSFYDKKLCLWEW